MTETKGFVEQWERLGRWFSRFEAINNGREHTMASDYYQDEVFAFFLNCYHLKDWIKNDENVESIANAVELYVKTNFVLALCGDICNSHKHYKLLRAKTSEEPQFGDRQNRLVVGTSPVTISVSYVIQINSGNADAFHLAELCIQEWEAFFAIHRINVKRISRTMTEEQRRGKSLVEMVLTKDLTGDS